MYEQKQTLICLQHKNAVKQKNDLDKVRHHLYNVIQILDVKHGNES
ncbi:hypothetical protein ACINWC743_2756 [Acinetobacter sp. WC-743]|nr:hypothetical protein ACINWC743_2756 [Acinetobacter sp. WC-743]